MSVVTCKSNSQKINRALKCHGDSPKRSVPPCHTENGSTWYGARLGTCEVSHARSPGHAPQIAQRAIRSPEPGTPEAVSSSGL